MDLSSIVQVLVRSPTTAKKYSFSVSLGFHPNPGGIGFNFRGISKRTPQGHSSCVYEKTQQRQALLPYFVPLLSR
jgi:hypothetical protein